MIRRAEKNYIPDEVVFKTKPQIALDLIDRAKANGIKVDAWTADELDGRSGPFLDGLDQRGEAFVVEIPPDAHVWLCKPKVLRKPPKNTTGRPKKYPRLCARDAKPSEVRNLAKHSPGLTEQRAQRYKTRDGSRGPEVWEIKWHTCWRKAKTSKLISNQCTVIVAKNVLTDEVKYFLSNRLSFQSGSRTRRMDASPNLSSRLWPLGCRGLRPGGEGGIRLGSFRVPWLAMHPPPPLHDDS